MSFKVTVRIGGLVMLVQPKKGNGKYSEGMHVLFNTEGKPHHTALFCPDIKEGQEPVYRPFAGTVDLHKVLKGGDDRFTVDRILPTWQLTGKYVDEQYLNGQSDMAARVLLPYPIRKKPHMVAGIKARAEKAATTPRDFDKLAGILEFEYVADGKFPVPGGEVTGQCTIGFEYRPHGEESVDVIEAGVEMPHAAMHLKWLKSDHGYVIKTAEKVTLVGSPLKSLLGGNPVECTIGGGCPPDDPNCGDG